MNKIVIEYDESINFTVYKEYTGLNYDQALYIVNKSIFDTYHEKLRELEKIKDMIKESLIDYDGL